MRLFEESAQGLTRREFMSKSAKTGLLIYSAPAIAGAFSSGCSQKTPVNEFDLSQENLMKLIKTALSRGGDFAEVYVEHRETTSMSLSEDKIKSLNYSISQGVGIRVISGEETGYAYTDDFSMDELQKTAETASAIAHGKVKVASADLTKLVYPENINVITSLNTIDEKKKIQMMKQANEYCRSYSNYIKDVYVNYSEEFKNVFLANSNGVYFTDEQPLTRFSTYVNAIKGDVRQSGSDSIGGREGWEMYNPEKIEKVASKASKTAVGMLDSKECPSGEMAVIMPNGWGGVLLHEAIGHGFEGDFIRKGTSVFSDKLGKRVADPKVTVVDDGTIKNKRGTLNADDEGTLTQKTVLIENGICRGFMYDLFNSKLSNVKSTGNGRRQSFRHTPLPRMTNTIMQGGTDSIDDMVSNTKYGLNVKQLSGGSVDITSGNFVFNVTEAYMVENGKETYPVRGASLIGKGSDVLEKIDLVGGDVDTGDGSCGKDGQSVPVTVGQPELRISKCTVGGTKT